MRTVVLLRTVVQRTDSNHPAARFAAEAAARRLPLKRQCCARSRADAEPRGYPRPYRLAALRLLSTTAPPSPPAPPAPSPPSRPPIRAGAALRLHPALDFTALGGQRSPRDHATVAVAAVVLTAAVSGHAAAGHALIRFQLVPRRRWGRAGCGLTGAIVPRDCEQLVAARAAQAGRLTVRQARPMTAARAY